jgi:hypothetical protein
VTPERQVLYALVGAGFLVVVGILIGGAAAVGLAPAWWTIVMTIGWVAVAVVVVMDWRNTRRVLLLTILLFLAWTVGTLIVV